LRTQKKKTIKPKEDETVDPKQRKRLNALVLWAVLQKIAM